MREKINDQPAEIPVEWYEDANYDEHINQGDVI